MFADSWYVSCFSLKSQKTFTKTPESQGQISRLTKGILANGFQCWVTPNLLKQIRNRFTWSIQSFRRLPHPRESMCRVLWTILSSSTRLYVAVLFVLCLEVKASEHTRRPTADRSFSSGITAIGRICSRQSRPLGLSLPASNFALLWRVLWNVTIKPKCWSINYGIKSDLIN